jgi:hypothetical protein
MSADVCGMVNAEAGSIGGEESAEQAAFPQLLESGLPAFGA